MIDLGKVDRFIAAMELLKNKTPAERQAVIDVGKRDNRPRVALFFRYLERELLARGHLPPPEKGVGESSELTAGNLSRGRIPQKGKGF